MWWSSRSKAKDAEAEADSPPSPEIASNHTVGDRLLDLQRSVGNQSFQRMIAKSASDFARTSPSQRAPSGGEQLPQDTRELMESRFGEDFSGVRVHADNQAADSAVALGANAYTTGRDIYFGAGKYAPETLQGRELLAHELVHTVQQRESEGREARGEVTTGPAAEALEAEAESVAHQTTSGRTASVSITGRTASPAVQRQKGTGAQPLILALPREKLKLLGNPDIDEIIDALPQRLINGQSAKVKEEVVQGVRHSFELAITIEPGAPPVTGAVAAHTSELVSNRDPARTIHRIPVTIFQKLPDPHLTLFHELIHVRLIIDRYLPREKQSATFRRFAQLEEMATDEALLIVTGAAPRKEAVIDRIGRLRSWHTTFIPGFQVPPAASASRDGDALSFFVNEKFTSDAAYAAFKKPVSNEATARRYAVAFASKFQEAAQDQGLFQTLLHARQRAQNSTSLPSDTEIRDSLAAALKALYDALDEQKKQIEAFKQAPPSAPPPGAGSSRESPVDIQGNPTKPQP